MPNLHEDIQRFLFDQQNPDSNVFGMDVGLDQCPQINPMLRVKVYHSAISTYHAPSDLSGIGGMHRERIRATPSWQRQGPRHDCIFVEKDPDLDGFEGLHAAQVALFFSFSYNTQTYPCAYVRWFKTYARDEQTGMWMIEPDIDTEGQRITSVIHIDSVLRSAHLIGVYGSRYIPHILTPSDSLYAFRMYYVNKFADHHSNEIAF